MESNANDRIDDSKDGKTSAESDVTAINSTPNNSESLKDDAKESELSSDSNATQKRTHELDEEEDDTKKKRRKGNYIVNLNFHVLILFINRRRWQRNKATNRRKWKKQRQEKPKHCAVRGFTQ